MRYNKTITLKDGRTCILRNAEAKDGRALLECFVLTHEQTDYLLTYPDETGFTVDEEEKYLEKKTDSPDEIELCSEIDGIIVGSAGIERIGTSEKLRHRADYGISIDRNYWGLGIGRALTRACIECAKQAGYLQLELQVVAENKAALSLTKAGLPTPLHTFPTALTR